MSTSLIACTDEFLGRSLSLVDPSSTVCGVAGHFEFIERATENRSRVGKSGDRRHEWNTVQEKNDVSIKRVGHRLPENDFKPRPACLIEPPHSQARCHQNPEEPGVAAAVESISDSKNNRGRGDQQRDGITHHYPEEWVRKHNRRQNEGEHQRESAG